MALLTNGPLSGTGYGAQTAMFCKLLKEAGHDVAISAFYGGIPGAIYRWHDIPVYPGGLHQYGNDVILRHAAQHFGGDLQDGLIVTLVDVWVLDGASHTRVRVANWTPVDHKPIPAHCRAYFDASGSVPIAMSRFGEGELHSEGFNPLYCPHGVDTGVFHPRDRRESRKALGLPEDVFLVGMVAANKGYPPRKGFSQGIEAFAKFRETHADALLYLHTETTGAIQGVNIPLLLNAHKLPQEAVVLCDQYRYMLSFPVEYMRAMYSALDVLLNPSFGEGFGIPIIEAAACGTPAIVTGWTSMPEVGRVGWGVGGQRFFTDQRSFMLIPDVDQLAAALESAYTDAAGMRDEAREHALTYGADRVTQEFWIPALAQLEEGVRPLPTLNIEEVAAA